MDEHSAAATASSNTTETPATNQPPPSQSSRNGPQTATSTIILTQQQEQSEAEVLRLTLRQPPAVSWGEDVVDNEGLGRKSSKRCCIFHKQREFGESSTESSDNDSDGSSSSGGPSSQDTRKIARPKEKKIPDFQRYHA